MSTRETLKSTALVSLLTGLSRVLGFVREMAMAYYFGTALAKSAFDIAFKIPNLLRRLFGEGALSAAFIPVFSETLEKHGETAARRLAARVLCLLCGILMLVAGGGIGLSLAVLPRFTLPARVTAILPLLAITLPYMVFICLVAVCMGMLHVRRRFAVPAATPLILNTVWILSLLFLCPLFGDTPDTRIRGVAWGVLAAGVLQLAIQIPALRKAGVMPDFRGCLKHDPHVRRVIVLMAPVALGAGLHDINVLVDSALALYIGFWAPAALTYADRLIFLPLGVFATALATVLLPTFSRQAAQTDFRELARTLTVSLTGLLLVMIPVATAFLAFAGPIVQLVFEWRGGEFDAGSSVLTARALIGYAPGLVVFSIYKAVVPAFYALQDTRTPLRVGAVAIGINLILNITFVFTWPGAYRHAGLAFASVLSQGISGLWLGRLLYRRLPDWHVQRVGSVAWRAVAASLAGAALAMFTLTATEDIWPGTGKFLQALRLSVALSAGGISYLTIVSVLCRQERNAVIARIRRHRTIAARSRAG